MVLRNENMPSLLPSDAWPCP